MTPPLRFGIVHDFRNRPSSGVSDTTMYAEILDQIVWAEEIGFDLCWFTEHHFVEDGYLPAWIPVAGAVLGRTSRMRVSTDIALLPFYHPIRLAEDLAVLDILSGGRVEMGVGMGYAPHEFAGFGIPVSRRVSLTEEGLDVLRLAWSGKRFSYEGRRYRFDDVRVTPAPVQEGGPPLWMGAMTQAGARRAARYGTHFLPQGNTSDTLDVYRAEVSKPEERRIGVIRSWLVTEDPERDWPPVREAERYRMSVYARFFAEAQTTFKMGGDKGDGMPQKWVVGSVQQVTAQLSEFIERYGITDLITWGAPPGLRPEQMNPSLQRFASDVMPVLRDRFAGADLAQP